MRKIKDALRLKLTAKLSHRQIGAALGISKGVVTKHVGLASASLKWVQVQDLDEAALERLLLISAKRPHSHVQPDYGSIHHELRRKHMTLKLLWKEHRADYADRHTYVCSLCANYRIFVRQLTRSMRQIHRAGEKLFIDYAGPTTAVAPTSSWRRWALPATPTPTPRRARRWPTGSNRRRARWYFKEACRS